MMKKWKVIWEEENNPTILVSLIHLFMTRRNLVRKCVEYVFRDSGWLVIPTIPRCLKFLAYGYIASACTGAAVKGCHNCGEDENRAVDCVKEPYRRNGKNWRLRAGQASCLMYQKLVTDLKICSSGGTKATKSGLVQPCHRKRGRKMTAPKNKVASLRPMGTFCLQAGRVAYYSEFLVVKSGNVRWA